MKDQQAVSGKNTGKKDTYNEDMVYGEVWIKQSTKK